MTVTFRAATAAITALLILGCAPMVAGPAPETEPDVIANVQLYVAGMERRPSKSIPLFLSIYPRNVLRDINFHEYDDRILVHTMEAGNAQLEEILIVLHAGEGFETKLTAQQLAAVVTRLIKAASTVGPGAVRKLRINVVLPDPAREGR